MAVIAENDGDGVPDADDNCPADANPAQDDLDGDGQGDVCDPDDDGDGHDDPVDAFPRDPAEWLDSDGDGIGDNADPDDDGDTLADGSDNCPLAVNPGQTDSDGDGIGDACDRDQVVTPDPPALPAAADQPLGLAVRYTTAAPCDDRLTGLGLRIHWDSSRLAFTGLGDLLATALVAQGPVETDSADTDADPATDRFVLVAWADTDAAWPGTGCAGATLFSAGFRTLPGFATATRVRFSASSAAAGYDFRATASLVYPPGGADSDGDGIPDADDNCPADANPGQEDHESDGLGDACDPDDDNDGLPDAEELALGSDPRNPDTDGDGIRDGEDPNPLDRLNPIPPEVLPSRGGWRAVLQGAAPTP